MTEIKGWHVLSGFILAFGVIITVNLTLAFNAVRTFPGLEVKNSYVASQSFEIERASQEALGWSVSAKVTDGMLVLSILEAGKAINPLIESATFGRATNISADQTPKFQFDGQSYIALVDAPPGNWNLRLRMRAENGELFKQRIQIWVQE